MGKYGRKKRLMGIKLKDVFVISALSAVTLQLILGSFNPKVNELPSKEIAYNSIYSDVGGKEYSYLSGARLVIPKKIDAIPVNINFKPTEEQKRYIVDAITEFNAVFEKINPNYKFKVNFNPSDKDLKNEFGIVVETANLNEYKNDKNLINMGTYISYKENKYKDTDDLENYNSYILLDNSSLGPLERVEFLGNVMRHEIMHALGFNDAYENSFATTQTIMQRSNTSCQTLTENDVLALYRLYSDPNASKYSNDEIMEWISSYSYTSSEFDTYRKIEQEGNSKAEIDVTADFER